MSIKKLRIAMFCTNKDTTPPEKKNIYAPLWITYTLAQEMTNRGHQVYLFAAAGSHTKAKLISDGLPPLEKNKKWRKVYNQSNERWKERLLVFYENMAISKLHQMAQKGTFDVLHIHPIQRAIHFAPLIKTPIVYTMHDSLQWNGGIYKLMFEQYNRLPNIHFVPISKEQKKGAPYLKYLDVIYHGIDTNNFSFHARGGDYLLSIGRIIPEKGVDQAILASLKTKSSLLIAGSHESDQIYWETKIKPFFSKNIKYLDSLPYQKTIRLYQKARATIFPIQWREPFGLVMIESMACGTPVIAYNRGSVPEIIIDGETGFIVNPKEGVDGLVKAIKKLNKLTPEEYLAMRLKCRARVEEFFSIKRMVDQYEKIYYSLVQK